MPWPPACWEPGAAGPASGNPEPYPLFPSEAKRKPTPRRMSRRPSRQPRPSRPAPDSRTPANPPPGFQARIRRRPRRRTRLLPYRCQNPRARPRPLPRRRRSPRDPAPERLARSRRRNRPPPCPRPRARSPRLPTPVGRSPAVPPIRSARSPRAAGARAGAGPWSPSPGRWWRPPPPAAGGSPRRRSGRDSGCLCISCRRTGPSGPARCGSGSGSTTIAVSVDQVDVRRNGEAPSTAAYSVAPRAQMSEAGPGSWPWARSGAR
jgi:hypothetical protein